MITYTIIELKTLGEIINHFAFIESVHLSWIADKIEVKHSTFNIKMRSDDWTFSERLQVKDFIRKYYEGKSRVNPFK